MSKEESKLNERMLFNVPFVADIHRRSARNAAILLRALTTCVTPETILEEQLRQITSHLGSFAFHRRRLMTILEIGPPNDWYIQSADMKLTDDNLENFDGERQAPVETNFLHALNRIHHISGISPQMIRSFRPKMFRPELDEGELRLLIIDTDNFGPATIDVAAMAHAYLAFIDKSAKDILDIV